MQSNQSSHNNNLNHTLKIAKKAISYAHREALIRDTLANMCEGF